MQIDEENSVPVETKDDKTSKTNQNGKPAKKAGAKKKTNNEDDEEDAEGDDSEEKSGPLELGSEDSQENEKQGKKHYFVKFKSLQYDEATWEDAEFVEREYPEL